MRRTVVALVVMVPGAAWSTDIIQVARETGNYTRFVDIVERAGLTGELTSAGPYTVFMPSDVAFERMPPEAVEWLSSVDRDALRPIVQQHVIRGVILPSNDIPKTLKTAAGGELRVTWELNGLSIFSGPLPPVGGKARVVRGDLRADNGVVHTIDAVLLPVHEFEIEAAAAQAPSGTTSAPQPQVETQQPQQPTAADSATSVEATTAAPAFRERTTRVYTYVPKPVSPQAAVTVVTPSAEPQRAERQLAAQERVRPVGLTAEELEEMTVVSSDRDAEGVVEGILLTLDKGEIHSILVRFSGFLGMFGKLIVVPWEDVNLAPGQSLLVADITAAEIERAEGADLDRYELAD